MITQKILARTDSLKLDKIISRYGEDSMRQVIFIVVRPEPDSEDLIPITIPEDAVGSFRILKPSGNFVIVPMSKSVLATGETVFDVVLPASANTAKGSGYYDIRITSETDKYYFTAQGDFLIDDNIISDEALEDVSEVNGLIFPDDFLTVEDHVAIIDDDTVSTDSTWSSDKINDEIEAHAGGDVSKTVSGNPITFTDGADAPLVKCVTEIQGSQDLHGYDKPWVGGAGKNKLPMVLADIKSANTSGTWNGNVYTLNGMTFTVLTDEGGNVTEIIVKGTAASQALFNICNVELSGSYILNGAPQTGSDSTYALYATVSGTYGFDYGSGVSVTFNRTSSPIRIVIRNGYAAPSAGLTFYPMLRLATVTDSTFTPYSNICPITAYTEGEISVDSGNYLNGVQKNIQSGYCVFGGTLQSDTPDGSLIVDSGMQTFLCDETLSLISIRDSSGAEIQRETNTDRATFILSNRQNVRIVIEKSSPSYDSYSYYLGTTLPSTHTTTYPSAIYRGSEDVVKGEVTTEWAVIASYAGETLPGEWISDRDVYAPGTTPTTGAQVAYELATPTTSSVTPTNLPIKSLSGYTHIESSTGDMEVEYITGEYQPIADLIEESGGGSHTYSTTEQVVGKWIDGSDVMEIVIEINTTIPASGSTTDVSLSSIPSGSHILSILAYNNNVGWGTGGGVQSVPCWAMQTNSYPTVSIAQFSPWSFYATHLIVQYIKQL